LANPPTNKPGLPHLGACLINMSEDRLVLTESKEAPWLQSDRTIQIYVGRRY